MPDRLSADEVRKIRDRMERIHDSAFLDFDAVDMVAVCDSHEVLRRRLQGAVKTVADLAVENGETIKALLAERDVLRAEIREILTRGECSDWPETEARLRQLIGNDDA